MRNITDGDKRSESNATSATTAIFVAIEGKLLDVITITDPMKATTPEALAEITAGGISILTFSKDSRTAAEAVARRLGIVDVESEALPDWRGAEQGAGGWVSAMRSVTGGADTGSQRPNQERGGLLLGGSAGEASAFGHCRVIPCPAWLTHEVSDPAAPHVW
jgi:magnesium-transporting ATPase (P-type)